MVLSPKRLKRFWQIRRVVNKYGLREFMGKKVRAFEQPRGAQRRRRRRRG